MNASAQSLHLLDSACHGALRFITGYKHEHTTVLHILSLTGPYWAYTGWFIGIILHINLFLAYGPFFKIRVHVTQTV